MSGYAGTSDVAIVAGERNGDAMVGVVSASHAVSAEVGATRGADCNASMTQRQSPKPSRNANRNGRDQKTRLEIVHRKPRYPKPGGRARAKRAEA